MNFWKKKTRCLTHLFRIKGKGEEMTKQFEEPEEIEFADQAEAMLDDDWYMADFENYEVLKKVVDQWHADGIDKVLMWFKIYRDDGDPVYLSRRVNRSWGPRSGLKQMVAAMLGVDVNEPLPMKLTELRGTKCEVLVETTQDGRYNNIVKVRKPSAKKTKLGD